MSYVSRLEKVMSYISRVFANRRSRNLPIVACIAAVLAFAVHTLTSCDAADDGTHTATAAHVEYDPNTGQTGVVWQQQRSMNRFCGDQTSRFTVGHTYRVYVKSGTTRSADGRAEFNCDAIVSATEIK
jgi:hypothetical protein